MRLVRDETEWTAWARYSGRQDRRMEWTGLVGSAAYEGDLSPFWPYLVFGQWTHVGSGCTSGPGQSSSRAALSASSMWARRSAGRMPMRSVSFAR